MKLISSIPWQSLKRFLSSMEVAIALLIMVAIASIIGTTLQQNQPYTDYAIKFGPFWFEWFKMFGLYNIYSQWWFLFILIFLVVSVCFCISRQLPNIIKTSPKTPQRINSWQDLNHRVLEGFQGDEAMLSEAISQQMSLKTIKLPAGEFASEFAEQGGNGSDSDSSFQWVLQKGQFKRLGYLLTHVGVVVICVSAIVDSTFHLKIAQVMGDLVAETRNIAISKVPQSSWIDEDNHSFRGSVSLPEGKTSNVLFLPWNEGYLIQKLPFYVQLLDFRVQHYSSGQPKAFESDLALFDEGGELLTTSTISVNKPLSYDGVTIFQSSFEDGGSLLDFKLRSFYQTGVSTFTIAVADAMKFANIGDNLNKDLQFELIDFRLFNIEPLEHNPRKFKNNGPSFQYKIRNASGQAHEYNNFMLPIKQQGRYYLTSGVRENPASNFKFLFLPLDENRSLERFWQFVAILNDRERLQTLFAESQFMQQAPDFFPKDFLINLVQSFVHQGYEPIFKYVDTLKDEKKREQLADYLPRLVNATLSDIYLSLLEEIKLEETKINKGVNQGGATGGTATITIAQQHFFEDTVLALSTLRNYAFPYFVQLNNFKHIQASGLQMTRSPGEFGVLFGSVMLVIGIFCLFYFPSVRLWVIRESDRLVIATHYYTSNLQTNMLIDSLYKKLDTMNQKLISEHDSAHSDPTAPTVPPLKS